MNIIFIAPPAAGKGTQASLLKEEFGLYHLSTGDLLREIAATNTEIGKEIKNLIDNGLFVSDELMLRLLESKISSIKRILLIEELRIYLRYMYFYLLKKFLRT